MRICSAVGRNAAIISIIAMLAAAALLPAQEETSAERQYREDYERYQKIAAISDPARRADQLVAYLKERPDSKLVDYAQGNYLQILEGFLKAENFKILLPFSERFIKLRPRVGETYYFYGAALKDANRPAEAMQALAKCYLLRGPASAKAKAFLEFVYKTQNQGSLLGMNKILKQAQDELNK